MTGSGDLQTQLIEVLLLLRQHIYSTSNKGAALVAHLILRPGTGQGTGGVLYAIVCISISMHALLSKTDVSAPAIRSCWLITHRLSNVGGFV